MPDPAQLAALASIHRRGSFELAAAELHVTPSAISQRLKALEEAAGALLIRRGQPCLATEAGLRLIRHHDELRLLEQRLAEDLPALAKGPATLRIAINADSLATWVMPALAQVEGLLYDIVIDDQDHSQDWLRRGEVMAAITSTPRPPQGCDGFALGALRYRATASPAYIARWFPQGLNHEALSRAPALSFSDKDRLQNRWVAARLDPAPQLLSHRIATSQAFVDACLLSMAWGMNLEQMLAPHFASGRLCELVPDTPLDVPLYWQFSRIVAPALAPVTKAVKEAARLALVQG